ncbi:hypothetical protein HY522_10385 [bacterium]|nr:hypothetical protein [bacterium]
MLSRSLIRRETPPPLRGRPGGGFFLGILCLGLIYSGTWALAAEEKPAEKKSEEAKPAEAAKSKTQFYRVLARKQAATIDDAIRAVARYKGGPEEIQPLPAELDFLKKQKINFPADIIKRKDETLTNGTAANMLMRAMGIKGGFMYRFFPDSQRIALREAVASGIIPANTFIDQTMSGNDLMAMLLKVIDAKKKEKTTASRGKSY